MKGKINIKNICLSGASAMMFGLAGISCTDLTEKTFDRIDADAYYKDAQAVEGVVSNIYSTATRGFFEYFWYLNEFPADQIAWRTWNGGAWGYDEAEKFVLSTQTWNSESEIIKSAWENAWETIGKCNSVIEDLGALNPENVEMSQEQLDRYIAEARTMRAWAYYNNFELWGGALPLNTHTTGNVPGSISENFETGCKLMWEFIADELDACYEDLAIEDGSSSTRTIMNQGMNRMLKMRLLLNSDLWIGEAKYAECAALAQEILEGKYGQYSLASDYRKIYDVGNQTCPEVVFCFYQEVGRMTNNNRNTPFLPYNYGDILGGDWDQGGWNCTCLVPSYDNTGDVSENNDYSTGAQSFLYVYGDKLGAPYDRMHDSDIRKQPFHCDAAGNWNGIFLIGAQLNYITDEPVPADADLDGKPLYYTDQVGTFSNLGRALEPVMSPRWGMTNSGYRVLRYPIYPSSTGKDWRDAYQVEFRLAEVYYTLAECKMRMGGGTSSEAVQLVNDVRSRYFASNPSAVNQPGPGFNAFDMDWLLSQWGLEFLDEGRRRRTDLRRFDKFTQGQWWFFGRATETDREMPAQRDRKYEWYPLPQTALMVNPGLVQNPNY